MPVGGRFTSYQPLLPMTILQIPSTAFTSEAATAAFLHAVMHNSPASGRTL